MTIPTIADINNSGYPSNFSSRHARHMHIVVFYVCSTITVAVFTPTRIMSTTKLTNNNIVTATDHHFHFYLLTSRINDADADHYCRGCG